ncbi:MAG TPA: DUF1475 family protein [Thermoanaerobaculia bacterium]|jgi:hypothetical protein|nr:DUF1475 family protein [Thermoanaerobaculia bacterium]
MKRLLIAFWSVVLIAMIWVTTWASLDRNVLLGAANLWHDPWGRATLFDTYFAFLAVWVWIAWRERTPLRSVVWLVLLFALGNIAIALYFLAALLRLPPGESWDALFRPRATPKAMR